MKNQEVKMKILKIASSVAISLFILILVLSNVYTLKTGEEAVIIQLGKYHSTINKPGLHFKIPFIQKKVIVNVNEIKRLEFGFRTENGNQYKEIEDELMLLTKDGALINAETVFQYRISNPELYLFKVDDQIGTLKLMAESVRRRVIASYNIDDVMLTKKEQIQEEMKTELQKLCDTYKIGIQIKAVQLQDVVPPKAVDAAFKEVINAREDKESRINQAKTVANEIIPKARGKAQQMINEAEGYKQKRISEAKGDVASFLSIYEKYVQGKEVTRARMYLETMEEVLPKMDIYIVDKSGNTLKYIPLERNIVSTDKKAGE
ncbi:FtsH protease activity modulator HflK [Caloramator sp. mosi_1]|uniref:FtsH protease activity modulator HflK n=1 Tax=Caloramator sp. mosi_1 TaxID=3023090 RepID=UPI002361FDE2|nr:FtsH protease activity modulator HflK [Caloramator sp. mosi_1]WDC84377.1 FtsH protease activity modulator HflK [Caloramator sp. mosi_1]